MNEQNLYHIQKRMGEELSKSSGNIRKGTADEKGQQGEDSLLNYIEKTNYPGYHRILPNAFLQYELYEKKCDTQIDLIYLHEKGIFVFEYKNYSGMILGKHDDTNWVQILGSNSKEKFYNPIKQNETHRTAVSCALHTNKKNIFSYVVFPDNCKLDIKKNDSNPYITIIHKKDILATLQKDLDNHSTLYSKYKIDKMYEQLFDMTVDAGPVARQDHIERISGYSNGEFCPLCRKPLVMSRSQKGVDYLKCSSKYPHCDFWRFFNT